MAGEGLGEVCGGCAAPHAVHNAVGSQEPADRESEGKSATCQAARQEISRTVA